MEKETRGGLLDVANELRLAGSAIDDLGHTVSKAYSEAIGDLIGARLDDGTREEAKALESAVDDLRELSASCYKVALRLNGLLGSEDDNA